MCRPLADINLVGGIALAAISALEVETLGGRGTSVQQFARTFIDIYLITV